MRRENKRKKMVSKIRCKTRYPIILIHGLGYKDGHLINYWGCIPKKLKRNGADIYYGKQDSYGTIEHNAARIKRQIEKTLRKTHAKKVNIIAHSKGGVDARYVISSLGMANKVASLTTIGTPHRGSKALDILYDMPKPIVKTISMVMNTRYRLYGDRKPDFYNSCIQMTERHMKEFNKKNKNSRRVYYQSYASIMNSAYDDMRLSFSYLIIKLVEGKNDGLVTVRSAKWGKLVKVWKGISHPNVVDMKRPGFLKNKTADGIEDMTDEMVLIVERLKRLGF